MKKFLITEEDRERILLLYETTNNISESILIETKNPFKEENKRLLGGKTITPYNSSLVNGDLFYTVKNNDELKKWVLNTATNLLKGKTLNIGDETYTISGFNKCSLVTNMGPAPSPKNHLVFKDIEYYDTSKQFGVPHVDIYHMAGVILISRNGQMANEETAKKVYDFLANYLGSKHVPDEYFEIRKVNKKNTDF